MNIKWIFFDIGGVLADESEFLKIRQNYCWETINSFMPEITKENVLNSWPAASEMLGSLDENVIRLFIKDVFLQEKAIDLMKQKRSTVPKYYDLLKIRKEAIEVIPVLAKKYKLGIIANQSKEARTILENAGLVSCFQNTDVSADHQLSKPDPEYFKKVFEITGAKPEESIMVDDNIERGLAPAKKLGMTTMWYCLENTEYTPKDIIDFKINSFKEILDIV